MSRKRMFISLLRFHLSVDLNFDHFDDSRFEIQITNSGNYDKTNKNSAFQGFANFNLFYERIEDVDEPCFCVLSNKCRRLSEDAIPAFKGIKVRHTTILYMVDIFSFLKTSAFRDLGPVIRNSKYNSVLLWISWVDNYISSFISNRLHSKNWARVLKMCECPEYFWTRRCGYLAKFLKILSPEEAISKLSISC